MRAILTICFAVLGIEAAAAACSVRDVSILQADWSRAHGYITVLGELKNGCAEPAAIRLKAVLRDTAGKVVATGEFWPAGMGNVEPGANYVFEWMTNDVVAASKLETSVVGVQKF